MPTAPRQNKKMQKLLEQLIGIPPAFLKFKKTQKEEHIDRQLVYKGSRLNR